MQEMLTGIGTSVATLASMVVLGYVCLALFAWATGRQVLSPEWRPVALVRRSRMGQRRQLRRLQRAVDQVFTEAQLREWRAAETDPSDTDPRRDLR
jgi:hypothetical protein